MGALPEGGRIEACAGEDAGPDCTPGLDRP